MVGVLVGLWTGGDVGGLAKAHRQPTADSNAHSHTKPTTTTPSGPLIWDELPPDDDIAPPSTDDSVRSASGSCFGLRKKGTEKAFAGAPRRPAHEVVRAERDETIPQLGIYLS